MKGRYRKFHGKRALLNGPGFQTTAAIVAEIEDTSTWVVDVKDRYLPEPRIVLQFANCDRSISFIVDVDDTNYANDLAKVQTMISALKAFERGLKIERERYVGRKRVGEDDE